jgi:hypothetical protein
MTTPITRAADQQLVLAVIEAAKKWRKNWIDVEDLFEEQEGCKCEVCQLIRAVDKYNRSDNEANAKA